MNVRKHIQVLACVLVIACAVFLPGCYYDSEEFLFPEVNTQCDTATVTYSASVVPILQSYCISCHNSSNPSGGVNLNDYTQVHNYTTDLRNGIPVLVGVVRHKSGFSAMPPPPSGSLDECSLRKIEIWIESGALNN